MNNRDHNPLIQYINLSKGCKYESASSLLFILKVGSVF